MTLQTSGAITLSNIASEMGGSTPHSLSEYYKNGGLVGNHSNNPNVPTSGTISFSNFYGANNTAPIVVDSTGVFVFDTNTGKLLTARGFMNGNSGTWTGFDGNSSTHGSATNDSYADSNGNSYTMTTIFSSSDITAGRMAFSGDQTASSKLGTSFTVTLSGANSLNFTASSGTYNSSHNETFFLTQLTTWNTGTTTVTLSGGNF